MRVWLFFILATGCGRFGFGEGGASTSDANADGSLDAGTRQLKISVTGRGAAAGSFGVCTSLCSYTVSGDVVVDAYAADTWSLLPTSGCAGTTCTVPSDVDHLDLTFTQAPITANLIFVSSTTVSLTSGVGALDTHCQSLATAAGLGGTFIAFASTTTVNARDRFTGSRGWVRRDGMPIIDQVTDIGSFSLPRAITIDETGMVRTSAGAGLVATGSEGDGTVSVGNNCNDWSSTTVQMAGGQAMAASNWMFGGWVSICASTAEIYCMQTGRNVAVQVAPSAFPVGRRLFSTIGTLTPGPTGIAAADQLCQSEASAAGLTSTYRALLATTTQSAADHLGSLAGPWRRTDNALVTLGDLDTTFDVAITVDATGAMNTPQIAVAIAGLHALATASANCSDWTDPAPLLRQSDAMFINPFVNSPLGGSCGNAHLMCAEVP